MAEIGDLGNRIELLSMDRHFHDISLGLYEQPGADGVAEYLVHSYSKKDGVAARGAFIMRAMRVLGGIAATPEGRLRFACGDAHRLACKRLFIEAGKLAGDAAPQAKPRTIHDKKSGFDIAVASDGAGGYRVSVAGEAEGQARRLKAIAGGLRKLTEMGEGGDEDQAVFSCGHAHDELVGLMLVRALNVRAVLRAEDAAAAQGVLAAPSAQGV
jgi:hypothetical protein